MVGNVFGPYSNVMCFLVCSSRLFTVHDYNKNYCDHIDTGEDAIRWQPAGDSTVHLKANWLQEPCTMSLEPSLAHTFARSALVYVICSSK